MQHIDPRHELGRRGEKIAAEYLKRRGFSILECNWKKYRSRNWWELDIIAEKKSGIWPFTKSRLLSFVEVKTAVQKDDTSGHRDYFSGHPELQVNAKRQRRLIRASKYYLSDNCISIYSNWQIDVIAVMIHAQTDKIEIRYTEHAVSEDDIQDRHK